MNKAQREALDRAASIINITQGTTNKMVTLLEQIKTAGGTSTELQATIKRCTDLLEWIVARKGVAIDYINAAVNDANYPVEEGVPGPGITK